MAAQHYQPDGRAKIRRVGVMGKCRARPGLFSDARRAAGHTYHSLSPNVPALSSATSEASAKPSTNSGLTKPSALTDASARLAPAASPCHISAASSYAAHRQTPPRASTPDTEHRDSAADLRGNR